MKKIVVLGGGESGCGAAVLAQQKGYSVFVSDIGKIKDKYKNVLIQKGLSGKNYNILKTRFLKQVKLLKVQVFLKLFL
jgi:UDP-N-acetylmuramoylalanine--D-glutamate ligase